MKLSNQLPLVYKNFLNKNILNLSVNETKATCNQCIRACDNRFDYLYEPDLKCCTFNPFIPNFAVGAILKENLSGAQIIQKKIADSVFTLPLGIFPSFWYQKQFLTKKKQDFGRKVSLLCDYYDTKKNQCSIWSYRGVVCTTFFCRSSYGSSGQKFWKGLSDYLSLTEMGLAEDCLVMLDFSPRDLSDQLDFLNKKTFSKKEEKMKKLDSNELKKYWNGYTNKEDFYIRCYELVLKQKRNSFKEIIGPNGLNLETQILGLAKCL